MGDFVKSIFKKLTGGDAAEDAKEAAKKQEALEKIARDNQRQQLQDEEKKLAGSRPPRGRRLLIAPESGETGLKTKLG